MFLQWVVGFALEEFGLQVRLPQVFVFSLFAEPQIAIVTPV